MVLDVKKQNDNKLRIIRSRCRLVNEHDGDIVPNGIEQMADRTEQVLLILLQLDRTFALRAGKNVDEFLFEHGDILCTERLPGQINVH